MRVAALFLLVACLTDASAVAQEPPRGDALFDQRIRPLLAARCLECHGEESPEGKLRLTSAANLLMGGDSGPAAIAHKPDESLLLKAVSQTGTLKMPPDGKLSEAEIADLRAWVEAGLPWPAADEPKAKPELVVTDADRQHWSFRPIADPPLPAVRQTDWPQTSIDAFVLAKLEQAGLTPSPAVDRRSLLRRAYYDLIGLPPTWQEVRAFADDPAPDAFARVVDRLLASPRYGERWGRHWLDVARFADTKDGVLMYGDDRVRPYAYTYRDYAIRALNEDTPFDRFVEEQLAADLIEPAVEPWRLGAMGFLTLGRMYDNNVHDIIDDQIDTVSRGFLGLTASCARCHDHKYDPIPQADYYSLYGVFASSEAPLELPVIGAAADVAAGDAFDAEANAKRADVRNMLDEQYSLLSDTARQRTGDYLVRAATTRPDPLETAIFFLSLAPEDLRPPITARWRRYLERRGNAHDPVFGPWGELMQLPASPASPASPAFAAAAAEIVARWQALPEGTEPGQFNPLVREALAKASLASRAEVAKAYGDLFHNVHEGSKAEAAAAGTASPPVDAAARRQVLDVLTSRESPAWFPKTQTRRYMSRQETDMFGGKMQELDRMAVKSPHAPPRAMVLNDAQVPVDPCIFVRGNPSQRGRTVPRQFLAIVSPAERTPFARGSGRLELARAIASRDNPLTSRVIVNRVWMHHFGEPLVSTPSDFGRRSVPPVNPELLDHLAARFMAEGWSLKKLHRWIVLSAAYRQSTQPATAEAAQRAKAADNDNRLLWRAHRRRLDLESMRDTMLALSGRLQQRSVGRPVDIVNDAQSAVRTVYGLVDRQSVPSLFRAFDFATPDQSVERRPRTMAPQQALFALNSPFMVEQSKALAARGEIAGQADAAARVRELYHAVFARDPAPEESEACAAFAAAGADPLSQLSPWEQLAQVLLASNELMYLD